VDGPCEVLRPVRVVVISSPRIPCGHGVTDLRAAPASGAAVAADATPSDVFTEALDRGTTRR
jgi:hypothetical protein